MNDTSAQDAPRTTDYCAVCGESPQSATHEGMPGGHAWTRRAASQEAEAREAVLEAYEDSGLSPTFETDEAFDAAFLAALDAYAAAIRASERPVHVVGTCAMCDNARVAPIEHKPYRPERERFAALVEAATEARDLPMLRGESGVGATYIVTYKDTGTMERLEAALAALEEAGSV